MTDFITVAQALWASWFIKTLVVIIIGAVIVTGWKEKEQ